MEVIICPNAQRVGEVAAAKAARIAGPIGPKIVLGVATGSSPVQTFAELAKLAVAGELDLSEASAFALDEYVGIAEGTDHCESSQTVTEPMGLDPARVHVPDGFASTWRRPHRLRTIKAVSGVDIQFLGVGSTATSASTNPPLTFVPHGSRPVADSARTTPGSSTPSTMCPSTA